MELYFNIQCYVYFNVFLQARNQLQHIQSLQPNAKVTMGMDNDDENIKC